MRPRPERAPTTKVIIYMGDEISWGQVAQLELNFKEQDAIYSDVRTYWYTSSLQSDDDPQEGENVLFPHTWVPRFGLVQLDEQVASLV